jgi:hypothetical protein
MAFRVRPGWTGGYSALLIYADDPHRMDRLIALSELC